MRRAMFAVAVVVSAVFLFAQPTLAQPYAGTVYLTETEIHALLAGHALCGTNPAGRPFRDVFRTDGRLDGSSTSEDAMTPIVDIGTWHTRTGTGIYHAGLMCEQWQNWQSTCFALGRNAAGRYFFRDGRAANICQ